MRYSDSKKFNVKLVRAARRIKTHEKLLAAVEKGTSEVDRRGGIFLIGGNDPFEIAVRHAQASLRYDRLPSYWSQAAIILDWPDGASPEEIRGLQVPLPFSGREMVLPERNAVCLFSMDEYIERDYFPNLGFGALCVKPEGSKRIRSGVPASVKDDLVDAAINPCRERSRYRLWDWLGMWTQFCMAGGENPLTQDIPHPGAAFCEYVFSKGGLDLTPGLVAPNACPEAIWNTLLFWHERFDRKTKALKAWATIDAHESPSRDPESINFREDFPSLL